MNGAAMWTWRIRERLTPDRPKWAHVLMCQYCHGVLKWCRQQQREREAA